LKIKQLVINAIIGALYVVITLAVTPFSFGVVQLRLSEMLNHFVVFNSKYAYGLSIGVIVANILLSPYGVLDWILGGGHTIISLIVTILLTRKIASIPLKMLINTVVFSLFTFIIAYMLMLSGAVEETFWVSYGLLFASQFVTMAVGIPIMMFLNSKINFNAQMEK